MDGDSASSTEIYAILSSLAGCPLRQDLAVTGSVNQKGEIQAIGGVNQKIEGFFDCCLVRGLTGTQGVLIPASNEQDLMLRADVIEAVARENFTSTGSRPSIRESSCLPESRREYLMLRHLPERDDPCPGSRETG